MKYSEEKEGMEIYRYFTFNFIERLAVLFLGRICVRFEEDEEVKVNE